jgi:uncharacterized membrane protein YgcG
MYGLLDPAAAAVVEAHLATCPACAAHAKKSSGLIAAAAKSAFPGVNFQQPTAAVATPAKPAAGPSHLAWVPLVLAASVLLVAGGWALLATFDTVGYAAGRAEVDRDLRIVELAKKQAEEQQALVAANERRVKGEEDRVLAARREATKQADERLAAAGKEFKEVQEKWIAAEKAQVEKLNKLPFMLDVRGPATMLPGAPNEYTVRISDANGGVVPDPVTVEAVLKDAKGTELLREKFIPNPADGYKLKVPTAAWQQVSAGGDVFLSMTATDRVGAKSELTENLKLLQPVYTTFLTTDKPMYRPGETVYFRTLTLDRTRFLPPDRDVQVRFEIKAQSGQVLPGSALTGLARAGKITDDGKVETVLGPDGKPLRGIASAAFPLSPDLVGGEYTLNVFEVPTRAGETLTADANKPLAVRKFVVNNYTPETLLKKLEWDGKSYGPGDVVQARLEVKDQGKPVKATLGAFSVTADGKPVKLDFPTAATATTDENGIADFKFTLPKDVEEIKQASLGLSVTVGGVTEGFNKPVPLTSRRLTVEFFPEGGDLIAGVQNRVYLRATTATGKPADIAGTLMLGGAEVKNVTTVKTLTDADHPGANQGVGVFTFTPEADKQYTLKLSKPLGLLQPDGGYPLPKAKKEGLLLSVPTGVTQPTEPIKVAVTSAGKKRDVLVGAYVRGRSVAHTKLSLDADKPAEAALDLSGTKLGGVTRVTVFELPAGAEAGREDLKPLAERLVYRVPGETLKVSYTAKRTTGASGAFVPGEKVDLAVESRDENEQPKPAVLWAAVVNQSVLTMADEKTERSLPTHFLLNGEVKKGEDMEHADFLLTKHPKAAEALDLVLGTQGWRRFAEQAPAEFRKGVPAEEADRILLVSAANAALPTGMRPAMRGVFNEFYPKFETAMLNLETAERTKRAAEGRAMNGEDLKELSQAQNDLWKAMNDLTTAGATRDASLNQFARTSERLKPYDQNWEQRRKVLGVVVAALLGLAAGGIALGLKAFRGTTAGKALVGCSFGLLAVAAAVSMFGLITGKDNDTWRETAQKANEEFPDATNQPAEQLVTLEAATGAVVVERVPGKADFERAGAVRDKALPAAKAMAPELRPADGKMMEGEGVAGANGNLDGRFERFNQANRFGEKKDANGFPPPPVAAPAFGGPLLPPAAPAGPGGPGARPLADAKNDPRKPGMVGRNGGEGGGRGGFGGGGRPGGFNGGMGGGLGGGGFAPGAAFPGGPPVGGMAVPGAGPGGMQFPGDGLFDLAQGGKDEGGEQFALKRLEVQQRGLKFNDFLLRRQQDLGAVLAKGDEKLKQQKAQEQIGLFTEFLPQSLPLVVREYAHVRPAVVEGAAREDFTETLLWQPVLVTNADGKATTSFTLSDAVAPYRVLIAGHSLDGRIGSVSGVIEVRKPFSIDPKLPQEIGSADKLDVPLVGLNGTDEKRTAEVTVAATGMKVLGGDKVQLPLNGLAGGRKLVRLVPDKLDGELSVQVDGKAGSDSDSITRKLTVVADGFPAGGQKSDVLETKMTAPLELPKQVIPGTLTMKVTVYPNTLSEVQAGLDGLLREPHGCFEQTSTTNYPNVLVLDYLNETNQAKPEVSKRAKELLDRGYGKLTSFECQKPAADGRQGYEWFGGSAPPHESLTAYGLLQFTDMSRVFPVDQEMLKRTKNYLIGSKDGNGGFKKNPRALDTFGYAPAEIANAYIVWAITESERTTAEKSDLNAEVDALVKLARGDKANDPYFVGLVANSVLNRGERKAGEELLKKLTEKQDKSGKLTGATASVTNSTGQALEIETTALAVLGWLKANEAGTFRPNVDLACKYIGSQRSGSGDFGSTQSTILALKSLIEYARSNKRPAEDGTVTVTVGGAKVGEKKFTSQQSGPIVVEIAEPEKLLKDGKVSVDVSTDGKQPYPCTVSWECRTRTPNSSKDCPLTLATKLNKTEAAEGDTVRLGVTVTNLKGTQNGMVTAVVGIPAGLKVPEDMKQLKLLTEKGQDGKRPTVSYWEKRGRELVFYWHGLGEKETVEFGVDLIADVPGEYRGPASRVYLYYGAEHKMWADPVDVKIGGK